MDPSRIAAAMTCALRAHDDQACAIWNAPGPCAIGLLEPWPEPHLDHLYAPAVSDDKRYRLWIAGEIFNAHSGHERLDAVDAITSQTLAYRLVVLNAFIERGVDTVQHLDGEFLILMWDTWERQMLLLTDRFASVPLFLAAGADGVAFSSGVRGVLAAPGIPSDPDREALREAMTFGGFRVGNRTNVAAVKAVPPAAVVQIRDGAIVIRRYRGWPAEPTLAQPTADAAVEHAHLLWTRAVRRRLVGCRRPGQSLSGGLDSRAILAEGARHASSWISITYGLPGCDDARYAERAAAVAGATWIFHPLYSGRNPDWLERRSAYVEETDGLMQLGDLMHVECIPLQRQLIDVHLSGYIGDAVCGPTFSQVRDAAGVAAKMPFTGSPLGWSWQQAQAWAEEAIAGIGRAQTRFAIYEHKIGQSTNRIFQALAPYVRIRRAFLDHTLFDFFSGLAPHLRGETYHRLLRTKYAEFFAFIPDQSTGMPILTPRWRVNAARARRLGRRMVQPLAARVGVRMVARQRSYHDDERIWAEPSARARIESTILRDGSLCCDIFERRIVNQVLKDWFERRQGPAQVVGALYVYELYHRDLATSLHAARRAASHVESLIEQM